MCLPHWAGAPPCHPFLSVGCWILRLWGPVVPLRFSHPLTAAVCPPVIMRCATMHTWRNAALLSRFDHICVCFFCQDTEFRHKDAQTQTIAAQAGEGLNCQWSHWIAKGVWTYMAFTKARWPLVVVLRNCISAARTAHLHKKFAAVYILIAIFQWMNPSYNKRNQMCYTSMFWSYRLVLC